MKLAADKATYTTNTGGLYGFSSIGGSAYNGNPDDGRTYSYAEGESNVSTWLKNFSAVVATTDMMIFNGNQFKPSLAQWTERMRGSSSLDAAADALYATVDKVLGAGRNISAKDAQDAIVGAFERLGAEEAAVVRGSVMGYTPTLTADLAWMSFNEIHYRPSGTLSGFKTASAVYKMEANVQATNGSDLIYVGQSLDLGIDSMGGHDLLVFRDGDDLAKDRRGEGSDTYLFGGGNDVLYMPGSFDNKQINIDTTNRQLWIADTQTKEIDIVLGGERVVFDDYTLALDIEGAAGDAYRLYQAAFARTPDHSGLGYWIKKLDSGEFNLTRMANFFLGSAEFARTYGTPASVSNANYVELLYTNTLGRNFDKGGYDYWVNKLNSGQSDRAGLLSYFSQSAENRAQVMDEIETGIWFV